MTQSRKQIAKAWTGTAVLAALAILASGCDRTEPVATTDSLLRRDLTLASSEFAPAGSLTGDTAVANPGRVLPTNPSSAPANAPRASAPRASAPPRPRPARPAPVRNPEPVINATPLPTRPARTPTAPTAPIETVTVVMNPPAGSGSSSAGTAKTIGRGVALVGKTNAAICSQANRPGDRLVAILANEVVSPDGAQLAAGTPILVEMAAPATNGDFVFRVRAVMVNGKLVPVEGTVAVDGPTTKHRVSNGDAGTKIAGGAIVGAILGGIFGGGKGAAIGAAGGAAAGTVAAANSGVTETCLPPGTALTVTLSAPLVLPQGTP